MLDFERTETTHPEIAAELDAIRKRRGELTPEVVFAEARAKGSVLHSYFEWNQVQGWRRYNLDIAARMIRKVHYIRHPVETKSAGAPKYIRNPTPEKSGYIALKEIAGSATKTASALDAEVARIESALHRAFEIADAVDQGEALLDRVTSLVASLRRPARRKAA